MYGTQHHDINLVNRCQSLSTLNICTWHYTLPLSKNPQKNNLKTTNNFSELMGVNRYLNILSEESYRFRGNWYVYIIPSCWFGFCIHKTNNEKRKLNCRILFLFHCIKPKQNTKNIFIYVCLYHFIQNNQITKYKKVNQFAILQRLDFHDSLRFREEKPWSVHEWHEYVTPPFWYAVLYTVTLI